MIAEFFRWIFHYVEKAITFFSDTAQSLSKIPLSEWLQTLILIVLGMLFSLAVLKLGSYLIKNILAALTLGIKIGFALLLLLSFYYWLSDVDRACFFEIESKITRCDREAMSDFNWQQSWEDLKAWVKGLFT